MKITNEMLVEKFGFPDVILKNTWFWGGGYSNRYKFIDKVVEEFYNALKTLIEKLELQNEYVVEMKDYSVYLNGKLVFHFYQSRRHTYKKQNLKLIKEFIENNLEKIIVNNFFYKF